MPCSDSGALKESRSERGIEPLTDEFGRKIDRLRISLTQRCNHSCFFCHHEGEEPSDSEMTPAEIESLVRLVGRYGVKRVKLTGGEPLLRSDILDIIRRLSPITEDLSLTTNGQSLEQTAHELKKAGLDRINVSLHSLDPDVYQNLTGKNDLELVKRGILKSVEVGLSPVKVNVTLIKGYNEDEIQSLIEFAAESNTTLQLIELQRMQEDEESLSNDTWTDLTPLEMFLSKTASHIEKRPLHGRRLYTVMSAKGPTEVEVVRPWNNPSFCGGCTRLRITSDGKLKPCLMRNDNLIDIRSFLTDYDQQNKAREALEAAVRGREPFWNEVEES
ncbi:MAG: GTP 3',8-cyclase MoaA [Candidatus Thorarchaeota archaeon]|jgi:cyclic pyranopterin phosphate synthase